MTIKGWVWKDFKDIPSTHHDKLCLSNGTKDASGACLGLWSRLTRNTTVGESYTIILQGPRPVNQLPQVMGIPQLKKWQKLLVASPDDKICEVTSERFGSKVSIVYR
ncbi:hypothetical protein CHS0354_013967 [Potamilus streckersoni]|uniref:Uncharacterized protein n=1 Tax=Potamilus streckersoni TaxID=2493646 RepID=A0AAE0RWY8_9BIVA|nr:hypothetical protein CHS0354_013967 [Potamilus streckersoni]